MLLATNLLLGSCSLWTDDNGHPGNPRLVEYGQPVPKGGGVYKVGSPYKIDGKWYYPREDANYNHVGVASWYGLAFHGRRTANGEIYDMDSLSAAHPTLPLPSFAKVRNLENGREIVVRVNDRGPYARGREIDLSKRAAEMLAFRKKGTARVQVSYLGPAPLSGADGWPLNVRYAGYKPKPIPAHLAKTQLARSEPPVEQPARSRPEPKHPIRLASAAPDSLMALQPISTPPEPVSPALTAGSVAQETATIQAGSFRNPDNATRLRQTLSAIGPVEVTPVEVKGVTYYRVRVGPLPGGEKAREALDRVRAAGVGDARLITVQ